MAQRGSHSLRRLDLRHSLCWTSIVVLFTLSLVLRGATAQGDGGFCDTSYKREIEQDSTAGWRGCQKTPGCCFAHATQQCRACQTIRGTWSGLLGLCVFEPASAARSADASSILGAVSTGECVPVLGSNGKQVVDTALLVFNNQTGSMTTTDEPGTSSAGHATVPVTASGMPGPDSFNFDFEFTVDGELGHVDLTVDTFMGARLLLGTFEVQVPEVPCSPTELASDPSTRKCKVATRLNMAMGTVRPPTAHPAQQASVLSAEKHFVYFRGDLVAEWEPTPIEVPGARRFKAGACRHMVQPHETLTSIGARYKLTWQEVFALNANLVDPQRLAPGTVLAVGRHHRVRGPCKKGTLCYRQTSAFACTHNDECPENSVCQAFDDTGRVCVEVDNGCKVDGICRECSADRPDKCGESLYAIATRYGTSWQRVLDMNPQVAGGCEEVMRSGKVVGTFCKLMPGDDVCVVPYLRAAVCDQEYRRYPVVDNQGASWEEMGRYFSCNSVWMTQRLVDKCCHVPRCACCTTDGTSDGEATTKKCDANAFPVTSCIKDPTLSFCTADCSCQVGFVPLEKVNQVTALVETTCIVDTECKQCKDPTQSPPVCTICAIA